MSQTETTRTLSAPLAVVHHSPTKPEHLQAMAELAMQVEFTTIPAYLTAMYSLVDKGNDVYQTVRSVAVEEMLHFVQVANLLVAIGGRPCLSSPGFVPKYPCTLPSANSKVTPYIGLGAASATVVTDVFAAIETPAPYDAPAEGRQYRTIAQLYRALEDGLTDYVKHHGEAALFRRDPDFEQLESVYLGKFGGRILRVDDLRSARRAIREIVEQGEGTDTRFHTVDPTERWGVFDGYGQRTDGTYGPLLGEHREVSHYFKFLRAAAALPFPNAYPIVSNPGPEPRYANTDARKLSELFDGAYTLMLEFLEAAFDRRHAKARPFFSLALPLMHEVLPLLAMALMNTPIDPAGNASLGPNACPAWNLVGGVTMDSWLELFAMNLDAIDGSLPLVSGEDTAAQLLSRAKELGRIARAAGLGR